MDPIATKVVSSTAAACFAVDRRGCVVAWNAAATSLLGRQPAQALGRPCYSLLGGHDVFGNRLCGPDCPIMEMARCGEPVHDFDMIIGDAAARVNLCSLRLPDSAAGGFLLLHLLRPLGEEGTASSPTPEDGDGLLTSREVEVLRMLRRGFATREIAAVLSISTKTVRNHVQNSLRKLGAHSRLEALACARRRKLI